MFNLSNKQFNLPKPNATPKTNFGNNPSFKPMPSISTPGVPKPPAFKTMPSVRPKNQGGSILDNALPLGGMK